MTCTPGGWGYAFRMLAVLLVPILLMVVACLLERFESHAVSEKQSPRIRPSRPTGPPALALVPGDGYGEQLPRESQGELRQAS